MILSFMYNIFEIYSPIECALCPEPATELVYCDNDGPCASCTLIVWSKLCLWAILWQYPF